MPELRKDPIVGRWVIIATDRAKRPATPKHEALAEAGSFCPFCEGQEGNTPHEILAYRDRNTRHNEKGWRVRVVPNKFPIVGDGVVGAHEVVILSPAHHTDLGLLNVEDCTDVVTALRDRARFHLAEGCVYAQAFVNQGKEAGASLAHPHAQLVALDRVPPRVESRLQRFSADAVKRDQVHVIDDEVATVWAPVASTAPFALRAMVHDAGSRFDEAPDAHIAAIAVALHHAVRRLHGVLGPLAYNLVFESAPRDRTSEFQWWVDIVPRLTVVAGFELGTGIFVNVMPPDQAAAALRAVK